MVILWNILIFPLLVSTRHMPTSTRPQKFTSASVLQHPLLHRRAILDAAHDAKLLGESAEGVNGLSRIAITKHTSDLSAVGKNTPANIDTLKKPLESSLIPGATHLDAAKIPTKDVTPVHADSSVKPLDKLTKDGEPPTAQLAQGDSPRSGDPLHPIQASQSSGSTAPSTSSGQVKEGSSDPCLLRRYRRKRDIPPCNPAIGVPYPVLGTPVHPVNSPQNGHYTQFHGPPPIKPTFRSKLSAFARRPPSVTLKHNANKVGKHSAGLFKSAVGLTAATFYLAAKPFIIGGTWVGWAIGRTAKATIVLTGKGLRLIFKGAKTAGAATATGVVKTAKFGVKAAKAGANGVKTVGLLTVVGVFKAAQLVGKGVIGFMKLLARVGKMTLRGTGHLLAKTGEGIGKAGHKLKNIHRRRMV